MATHSPLFKSQHRFLVAIDSDGCAFDTMEIKHKECFVPLLIREFKLQAVSRYARECAEFVNLYSKSRGVNRFPAYLKTLELLTHHPEIIRRGFSVPTMSGLKSWVIRENKLSTKSITLEAEQTNDPDLRVASSWSQAVDKMISEMVHGIPPFPYVRETLIALQGQADIIVCSATPTKALEKEWNEHNLTQYTRMIYGQEAGSKSQILSQMITLGYHPQNMLMIGDSPGDMQAAKSIHALSYPIIPNQEVRSWEMFFQKISTHFLAGTYTGELHENLLREYDQVLPTHPTWWQQK